jgi:hypothetical protein
MLWSPESPKAGFGSALEVQRFQSRCSALWPSRRRRSRSRMASQATWAQPVGRAPSGWLAVSDKEEGDVAGLVGAA